MDLLCLSFIYFLNIANNNSCVWHEWSHLNASHIWWRIKLYNRKRWHYIFYKKKTYFFSKRIQIKRWSLVTVIVFIHCEVNIHCRKIHSKERCNNVRTNCKQDNTTQAHVLYASMMVLPQKKWEGCKSVTLCFYVIFAIVQAAL